MATKTILAKAPTRIDLAGGTVDLWPLYLFLDQPVTVNLGIDLFAEARLETRPGRGILLKSEDQGHETRLEWADLGARAQDLKIHPALELHFKLLKHLVAEHVSTRNVDTARASSQLTLSTRAKSPAGAGLGGSSTLSIAMVAAIKSWINDAPIDILKEGEQLIEIVRDVETTVIQVPAGVQDYYGAMFGGLQALRWGAGAHEREWLPGDILHELERRILLFYSGQSRNSGINNWALYKAFIDKQGDVRAKFDRINAATRKLEKALLGHEWIHAGEAIADEWETRRTLAAGISTEEMNRAFEKARQIAPGASGKVCGAGGGGCFFVYLPNPTDSQKSEIVKAFTEQGMRQLPFHAVPHGVEVTFGA